MSDWHDLEAYIRDNKLGAVAHGRMCYTGEIVSLEISLERYDECYPMECLQKIVEMADAIEIDDSTPKIVISFFSMTGISPFWEQWTRRPDGQWTGGSTRYGVLGHMIKNILQKRTTLFWELLTRVDHAQILDKNKKIKK